MVMKLNQAAIGGKYIFLIVRELLIRSVLNSIPRAPFLILWCAVDRGSTESHRLLLLTYLITVSFV